MTEPQLPPEPPLDDTSFDPGPTVTMDAPPSEKKKSPWMGRLAALLLIIAAGAGLFWLATTEPPADNTVASGDAGNSPENVDVSAPTYLQGAEPIADAAEKILPAVVQIRTADGVGSGVIFEDGLILTAAHVVAGEETVLVRLEDGENFEGTVVGGTSEADIAVVRIDRPDLPRAELALDYKPRVGQMAIAVGSPWDLQSTVTAGIVSAIDQPVGCNAAGSCRSMLQTDAAINPGNSGGALVDRDGRVIGINVSIFSLSGANDGVGFAVPIDIAYDLAQTLVSGDPVEFAFFGIMGEDATSGRAGAVVTEVIEGSAADEAGIELDDLIVSIDGVKVQGIADLASQVRSHRPGDTVEIAMVREGQDITVQAVLGLRDNELG
jgi:putative serine protease PepD